MTVTGDFQRFQYFNTETSFLTMKRFSQKVFLVKNNKIENALFPYKTALSEANLNQIEWWIRTGPITKNGVLPVTTFLFKNIASV